MSNQFYQPNTASVPASGQQSRSRVTLLAMITTLLIVLVVLAIIFSFVLLSKVGKSGAGYTGASAGSDKAPLAGKAVTKDDDTIIKQVDLNDIYLPVDEQLYRADSMSHLVANPRCHGWTPFSDSPGELPKMTDSANECWQHIVAGVSEGNHSQDPDPYISGPLMTLDLQSANYADFNGDGLTDVSFAGTGHQNFFPSEQLYFFLFANKNDPTHPFVLDLFTAVNHDSANGKAQFYRFSENAHILESFWTDYPISCTTSPESVYKLTYKSGKVVVELTSGDKNIEPKGSSMWFPPGVCDTTQ